jgi:hypothetical protein
MLAALHTHKDPHVPPNKTIFVDTYLITRENLNEVEDQIKTKLSLLERYRAFGN